MNLTKSVKISDALDYASGTVDRNGETLDMQGFEGVAMIVKTATIASGATTSIKAQQGDESDLSDAEDLEDTGITIEDDDDDEIFVIDLYKPEKRYVRLVIDKDGANACAESAVYAKYQGRVRPEDNNVTDEITTELNISPDEGTA
jgi:hypothetical protein